MLTYCSSHQRWLNAVKFPFTLQVINTATVIPANDHLLIPTTRVPPAIVTANPIKYRHVPSSHREKSDSARPSLLLRCWNWNERTGSGHIWWVETKRNWCRDLVFRPEIWRWVKLGYPSRKRHCFKNFFFQARWLKAIPQFCIAHLYCAEFYA